MTNLITHMAELRKILASIENNPITEGLVDKIILNGVKDLSKQGAKTIIKQLGEEVTVNVIRRVGKKKVEQEVELVLKAIPGQDSYLIVSRNGIQSVGKPKTLPAAQVADDVEKAVEAGRKVTLSGELKTKASSELAQQAVKDAENMTDAQLEAAIKDMDRSPALRKEYKEILDKRKASKTGDSESIKREAEMERKSIAGKSNDELQALYNNPNTTAVRRKAAKETLESRGVKPVVKPAEIPQPPAKTGADETPPAKTGAETPPPAKTGAETPPPAKTGTETPPPAKTGTETPAPAKTGTETPAPAQTAEEVLQAKKTAAAKAETEAALDAGEITIREADLLPAKAGETYTERVIRSLEQKPELADKWNKIKGNKGEEGFWQYVGKRKVASLLTALTVAAIGAGLYNSSSSAEDLTGDDEDLTLGNDESDAKANQSDAETARLKRQNDAASSEKEQGASTITAEKDGKETDGKETDGIASNSAEQEALLKQINALIDELSKSKDPAIQKRLAAVRARLGQSEQAASVISKDQPWVASGWYDIGRGYQRWYGPDGVDPKTGRRVKTGTTDIIPIDNRPRDKYADMSQDELANQLRKNDNAARAAKTKSNWN